MNDGDLSGEVSLLAMRTYLAFTAAAWLTCSLAGCGGNPNRVDAARNPSEGELRSLLARSAATMERANSAKIELSEVGPQKGTGSGSYSWAIPQAFSLTMDRDAGEGKMIIVDGVAFLGGPRSLAVNAGKKWLKVDPKEAESISVGAKEGPLSQPIVTQQLMNPTVQLAVSAQSGQLLKMGDEKVNGEDVAHVRSIVEPAKLASAIPGLSSYQQDLIKEQLGKGGFAPSFEFWINRKGELICERTNVGGGNAADSFIISYSDFGHAAAVAAPPAEDVMDILDSAKGPTGTVG